PFKSSRLSYRAVRPQDLSVFQALNDDPIGTINSSTANTRLPTPNDSSEYMNDTAKGLLSAVIWLNYPESAGEKTAMILKAKSQGKSHLVEEWGIAIGEIHLTRLEPNLVHHRWTEIGIDVLPEYQGRGYGSEAIRWGLDYAFRLVGLHRVRIRALGWNTGAIGLYERLGFRHEGREREAFWHEGRWWDGVTMGLLEGEWREMQEGGG
ncbi:acyl-CoA N-acyltransferase, partial [Phaeosphaeriaceae sp. PMI808]